MCRKKDGVFLISSSVTLTVKLQPSLSLEHSLATTAAMQNAGGAEGEQPSEEESDRELQDGGYEGAENNGESVPPAQEVQHVNRGIVLLKGFNFLVYSFINVTPYGHSGIFIPYLALNHRHTHSYMLSFFVPGWFTESVRNRGWGSDSTA